MIGVIWIDPGSPAVAIVKELPGRAAIFATEHAAAAKQRGTTTFHLMGTCRMAPDNDPTAVVDEQLRVRGIEGLRVVDASIMPTMPSANLNASVLMIAEKAAAMNRLADDFEAKIGEIVETYTDDKYLTNGLPDIKKIDPLIFSMHDNNYWKVGEHVAHAWQVGKDFKPGG